MEPIMPREDIVPVILGGDWSTYALAREFREAFGCGSICIAPDAVAVIKKSNFIDLHRVDRLDAEHTLAAMLEIASAHPGKAIVVVANADDRVVLVEHIRSELPANFYCPLPSHDLVERVSNKIEFARICTEYGMDTPRTEIVSLAGCALIPPTQISFPLVAKPATSSEYAPFHRKGFQKVYFMRKQAELDELWRALRAEDFQGSFLVQELIEGDDTYMDSLIMYVDCTGTVSLSASAHVLLEDHVPVLYGNPVAMITKPLYKAWEKAGRMLTGIGWRGFANIDLKRDPKTGRQVFMDFNPRIGSNSYYPCAAGANPMYVLTRDVVDGATDAPLRVEKKVLYTRVPVGMLRRYIQDPELLAEFNEVVATKEVHNPTRYSADTLASQAAGWAMAANYVRKFHTYYPKPTDTSF